jgi:hypothetical protein
MKSGGQQMDLRNWARLQKVDSDCILQDLTDRQHLRPHQTLAHALEAASASLGFCPHAAETALLWLQLDPGTTLGRLRRTQLAQLANSIHRFWQQALAMSSQPMTA